MKKIKQSKPNFYLTLNFISMMYYLFSEKKTKNLTGIFYHQNLDLTFVGLFNSAQNTYLRRRAALLLTALLGDDRVVDQTRLSGHQAESQGGVSSQERRDVRY